MDIYITILDTLEEVQLPILPAEIQAQESASFNSFTILQKGEVRIPNGVELSAVSFSSFFPGESRKHQEFIRTWADPKTYVNFFRRCKDDGLKCRLLVTETPITMDCYVETFSHSYSGPAGDIYYDLAFVEAKEILITDEVNYSLSGTSTTRTTSTSTKTTTSSGSGTYTVVSGDCLWDIAASKLGSGSRWQEIYNLNKSVIGSNPSLIYAGQVLKLP